MRAGCELKKCGVKHIGTHCPPDTVNQMAAENSAVAIVWFRSECSMTSVVVCLPLS